MKDNQEVRLGGMRDNKRDYKPFIVFAAAVIVVNVAALWFFLRDDAPAAEQVAATAVLREYAATPERMADASVSDDLAESPDADLPNGAADGGALSGGSLDSEAEVANHAAGNGDDDEAGEADKQEIDADDSEAIASQESCIAAASDFRISELSGIVIEKIGETDPRTLTDKQRREWFDLLSRNVADIVIDACKDLWSEPITADNADKRNDEFYSECVGEWSKDADEDYVVLYSDVWQVGRADFLELLERPYTDLTLTDRMLLRVYFSQSNQPIYRPGSYGVDQNCAYYYPQLFLDRWVPFSNE